MLKRTLQASKRSSPNSTVDQQPLRRSTRTGPLWYPQDSSQCLNCCWNLSSKNKWQKRNSPLPFLCCTTHFILLITYAFLLYQLLCKMHFVVVNMYATNVGQSSCLSFPPSFHSRVVFLHPFTPALFLYFLHEMNYWKNFSSTCIYYKKCVMELTYFCVCIIHALFPHTSILQDRNDDSKLWTLALCLFTVSQCFMLCIHLLCMYYVRFHCYTSKGGVPLSGTWLSTQVRVHLYMCINFLKIFQHKFACLGWGLKKS